MDIAAFEHDRNFVLEGLRRGEVDFLEPISQALEADLFRQLVGRDILARLAESYPTPRKKEEVPLWIYLASQLTLKLHGAAYHALPYVLRSGGLITALGPQVGRQAVHPETQDVTLSCSGFNHKNLYDRQTPCDQDFVRKLATSTDVDQLLAWFNREVPRCLRSLKLFDPEGLFIGDASYLFVPDNEHYEKSVVLLFDEHNHPVDPAQHAGDRHCQWRRCYKIVTLLHINRAQNLFLTVAARVLPGNQHECPVLYEMVEQFVQALDPGRMKILIVDRGLLDGAKMAQLKRAHNIDTVVPLRKNMVLYQDVLGLATQPDFPWEVYPAPPPLPPPPPPLPSNPVLARREQKRQQTLARRKQGTEKEKESKSQDPPNPPSQNSLATCASPASPSAQPRTEIGLVRDLTTWTECTVPLSVVLSRETDAEGETRYWALATTSATRSGPEIRSTYALRPAIEERHRQYKCVWDLAHVTSCQFSLVVNHVLYLLLAYTLLQAHLLLRHRQEMNPRTRQRQFDLLRPALDVIAVYYQQRFCCLAPTEFAVLLLELSEEARAKLLPKMKALHRDLYHLLQNARPP